jgi:SAM-dependent methyltransferase
MDQAMSEEPITHTLTDIRVRLYPMLNMIFGERRFLVLFKPDMRTLSMDTFWYYEVIDDKPVPVILRSTMTDLYHMYLRVINTEGDINLPKRTVEEVQSYWRTTNDELNRTISYTGDAGRSAFLLGLIQRYVPDHEAEILELGCSVGRNLNTCYTAGYCNLSGVEINTRAFEPMQAAFPDLTNHVRVYYCAIEDVIREIPTDTFDLIYTMAVLEHLPVQSNWVFAEIARVAKQYVIIVEDEHGISTRHFPRNYREVFEKCDLVQVEEIKPQCTDLTDDFIARVFRKERHG